MTDRKVRIGIDVGGTHTKAVAIDNATNQLISKGSVMTTHHHPRGVAQGVVDSFQECLRNGDISPDEVIFIAHSTTQATNALLEGDVATVGVLGMGKGGIEGFMSKRQTRIDDIDLGTGKSIHVLSDYALVKDVTGQTAPSLVDHMAEQGAQVIVASKAFGVDDATEEKLITDAAEAKGMGATAASDITKLYGLKTRTRTAALNASILPKMLETANSTEASVREAGITVPLMIMRGDGGVMQVEEMRHKPILTMLSGPAASVVGALMYLRASNGVYFEVGGTSTNIGVIKDARPAVDYSVIGGHRTYVNSLDVRVLGVAGGSMVRAGDHEIVDVGPRSAHIADLPYAAFTEPSLFEGASLYRFQPRPGDPEDYVAIRLNDGSSCAITNTCAANAAGLLDEGDYSRGSYESSRAAVKLLADEIGASIEETAEAILRRSCEKIIPVVDELLAKYKLEPDQVVLVGAGGGASTLLKYTGKLTGHPYQIPENAEVISSIGVALAMVREMVQRTIPNPTPDDIVQLKREARELAVRAGAVEETIDLFIEIDDQAQTVTAIAMGSTEVRTTDLSKNCSREEAVELAAESMGVAPSQVDVTADNGYFRVLTADKAGRQALRVVDSRGFIKVQRANAQADTVTPQDASEAIVHAWNNTGNYSMQMVLNPDVYIIAGGRLVDYSGLPELDQVTGLFASEFEDIAPDEPVIVVAARNEL
ncbi:hydantoinase/oxoprolinase family protein [Brooklawnia cerclae]|uniref:N-methylhydantoinase A/oxoprolinase/acetone carboxylase beta subunit n=1 Tax=Brooklawnia cerclae TaxID=349934 RepID=A0ABX0SFF1_9ACTN|nr:hydantoinase/oxoprolinase family protein [Brooklawnia cerclae]NIH55402.1 N-methylhydantoinase A/oxoprolinase/acetone carboxylase beta subunit [Brooklawnia cerclae]